MLGTPGIPLPDEIPYPDQFYDESELMEPGGIEEEPLIVEDDGLPPKIKEEIEAYVKEWCRNSREYVKNKEKDWMLLEALYLNKIGIQEWEDGSWETKLERINDEIVNTYNRNDTDIEKQKTWRSNYIHDPHYLVDNWTDNSYPTLFDGPDYLVVIPEESADLQDLPPDPNQLPPIPPDMMGLPPGAMPPMPDPVALSEPTLVQRLQAILLESLQKGKIHARIYDCLHCFGLYGTVFAKVIWHTVSRPEDFVLISNEGTEKIQEEITTTECPLIQMIPVDKILPDWKAKHNDIQRWRGIGQRVDKTWEDIEAGFVAGIYDLNENEFRKRWDRNQGEGFPESDALNVDEDSEGVADKQTWLQVWEWHGKAPVAGKGFREVVVTLLNDRGEDDPTNGIMIRLRPRPILPSGVRPFATAHFTQRPGPYGLGQIDRNRDILFLLSQLIGQVVDNARYTGNCAYSYNPMSDAFAELKRHGFEISPAMALPAGWDGSPALTPISLGDFPADVLFNLIEFLSKLLDRRTTQPDVYQGIGGERKTATEADLLFRQAQTPTMSRTDLLARNFIGPLATIALEMIREFSTGDQQIEIQQSDGSYRRILITQEELQQGKYRVVATLTKQDSSKIAKAQAIRQLFDVMPQMQGLLALEGQAPAVTELYKRFVDLLGVDGADRTVRPLTPQDQMAMGMVPPEAMSPPGPEGELPLGENGTPLGPDDESDLGREIQARQLDPAVNQFGGQP